MTRFSRSHLGNVEHGTRQPTEQLARACDDALNTGGELARLLASQPRGRQRGGIRPAQLPTLARHFAGRDRELATMTCELAAAQQTGATAILSLEGPGGIGKTALAVYWAHTVADGFPDGILFADLRGYDPREPPAEPAEVLRDLLLALGLSPAMVPRGLALRAANFRSVVADRRVLIVLDNAADTAQVRHLLPGSPTCAVVVTSRRTLPGLAARDGARRVPVGPLGEPEATRLLTEIIGNRARQDRESTRSLARQCGGHPLALRIAAERANDRGGLSMVALSEMLAANRLDVLSSAGDDLATVRTTFSWSYKALPAKQARLFRLLGVHPGPEFRTGAAAALMATDLVSAETLLEHLASAHLIEDRCPGRYRMHDLLRLYAAEQAYADEPSGDVEKALRGLLRWYLSAAQSACRVLSPTRTYIDQGVEAVHGIPTFTSYDDATEWCETERANLAAATALAAEIGEDRVAVGLPVVLCDVLYRSKPWGLWLTPHHAALERARRIDDRNSQAWLLNNLGHAYTDLGRPWTALTSFTEALRLREHLDDRIGHAWTRIGRGRALQALRESRRATDEFLAAMAEFTLLGDRLGEAIAVSYVGEICLNLAKPNLAMDYTSHAADTFAELGDLAAEGCARDALAETWRQLDEPARAIVELNRALSIRVRLGDRRDQARTLTRLGEIHSTIGDATAARHAWGLAVNLYELAGDPAASRVRALLAADDEGDDHDAAEQRPTADQR